MNPYCRLIPRLDGTEIEERFDYYLGLVRKGVAGFILFGGKLETVRAKIEDLRKAAGHPLIVASDLEQGLGQQLEGGTLFPPAMALTSALRTMTKRDARRLLGRVFRAMAAEARYAGIDTVLAPVLDINTNPKNPIIATRAFGEDPETVSFMGCEMIRVLRQEGITACGKHFPGHGDTEVDSHAGLPVIGKDLHFLEGHDLVPFQRAIDSGVGMIMLGHLSVPAMDKLGVPSSLSKETVSYLKTTMRFRGRTITDAMNMAGIAGYREEDACLMSLRAGVDLILHPSDPDRCASCLERKAYVPRRINLRTPPEFSLKDGKGVPDFREHRELANDLTEMAIIIEGKFPRCIDKPFLIVLNEDREEKGLIFAEALKKRSPGMKYIVLFPGEDIPWRKIPRDAGLIVAIFSSVRAWKDRAVPWIEKSVSRLQKKVRLLASFGNPYVLHDTGPDAGRLYAFWDSEGAQRAAAKKIAFKPTPS